MGSMTANPRDYGLPDDAVLINIDGVVRDLRTVPTEEGGDWTAPTPGETGPGIPRNIPPAPGTGTIFISPVADMWFAVWEYFEEGNPAATRSYEGPDGMTRDEAIAWAFQHAAGQVLIYVGHTTTGGEDYVPVDRPQPAR